MRPWIVSVVLLTGLGVSLAPGQQPDKDKGKQPRQLPGVQPDGTIRLHNTWSLRPAGKQLELGDFPAQIVLHPAGQYAVILHSGHGTHEIVTVDLKAAKPHIVSRTTIEQGFYGLCFAPDGKTIYASGGEHDVVHAFDFADGLLSKHRELAVTKDSFVGGIAINGDATRLAAAGTWGHILNLLPLRHTNAQA